MNKEILKSVNSREVNSLVSSPRLASGNRFRENTQDFESLSETIQVTKVCEFASFWYRAFSWYEIQCWRSHPSMPRIHTSSSKPTIQSSSSNSRFIEVHVVQVFGNRGLEIEIPSPNNPKRTSWILISRGKESIRGRICISPKCQTYSHQRGITL